MATYQELGIVSFALCVVFSGFAIWQARRVCRSFFWAQALVGTASKRPERWPDVAGVMITVVPIVAALAGEPAFAFLPVVAVVLAALGAVQGDSSRWWMDTFLTAGLTAGAWLSYGMYELQLLEWAKTIKGAPIRSDLLLLIPLLFSATAWTIRSWNAIRTAMSARIR